MHQHSGFVFEYIRTAIITDAYRKIKMVFESPDLGQDDNLGYALVALAGAKDQSSQTGLETIDFAQTIQNLLKDAEIKTKQAEARLRLYV